jgi:hypothetical protein
MALVAVHNAASMSSSRAARKVCGEYECPAWQT